VIGSGTRFCTKTKTEKDIPAVPRTKFWFSADDPGKNKDNHCAGHIKKGRKRHTNREKRTRRVRVCNPPRVGQGINASNATSRLGDEKAY